MRSVLGEADDDEDVAFAASPSDATLPRRRPWFARNVRCRLVQETRAAFRLSSTLPRVAA